MDGAELLTQVSQRHPEVARVVLSGHIEPEATVQVAVAGHRFLTKPSDAETLTAVIDQLLVRTSAGHEEQARRMKELERENARLKRAVAELTLDKQILKEAAEGKY